MLGFINGLLLAVAIFTMICGVYLFFFRPWLKKQAWTTPFFNFVEPIEQALWAKSRSIFLARLAWIPAAVLMIHDTLGSWMLDATPLLGRIFSAIPDDIRPMVITGVVGAYGAIVEWIRRKTSEALANKD